MLTLYSVDSLVKLHRKTKSTDVYLDDRGDVATTRIVWGDVRDNLERGEDDYSATHRYSPHEHHFRGFNQGSVLQYSHHRCSQPTSNIEGAYVNKVYLPLFG
jgi:hypothetical protein